MKKLLILAAAASLAATMANAQTATVTTGAANATVQIEPQYRTKIKSYITEHKVRPVETRETMLKVGPLEIDLIERSARRGDRVIELLPREFRLLEYMMQRSDQLLTRAMLLEEVWNYKFVPATNLIDVHMGRLRHKVDGPNDVPMIHNVRGAGFVLRDVS